MIHEAIVISVRLFRLLITRKKKRVWKENLTFICSRENSFSRWETQIYIDFTAIRNTGFNWKGKKINLSSHMDIWAPNIPSGKVGNTSKNRVGNLGQYVTLEVQKKFTIPLFKLLALEFFQFTFWTYFFSFLEVQFWKSMKPVCQL